MIASYDFISYVESADASGLSDMLASRIIPSFLSTVRKYGISDFSLDALKHWYVDMMAKELKPTTARRYIGSLHTLYKEWSCQDPDPDSPFVKMLPLVSVSDTSDSLKRIRLNYENLSNLIRITPGLKGERYVSNNAFMYLLFDPKVSLADLVEMKFSDAVPGSQHLKDIVTSMRIAPQAKYVFPLQQGKKRQPAILKDILASLHLAARSAGLNFGNSFSRESITSLWIYSALQIEIPIAEILSVVKVLPPDYHFLSVFDAKPLSAEEEAAIFSRVADNINNKSLRWYVMKLRSGVTPDDIRYRLEEQKNPLLKVTQFFYPMRQVKKIEKKKIITVETPFLPGILFFRLAADKVSRLMSGLGEWAWCFRTTASPASPYSAISQTEMRTFQRCIGSFTSDIEMDLISELPPLAVGDEVLIEDGGMLDGQHATIRKIKSVDGTVTYTLRLSDTAFIRWKEITLPASHLSKV